MATPKLTESAGLIERAMRRAVLGPVEGRGCLSDEDIRAGVALNNGGGRRRDYGPRGCAGIVLAPVLFVALLLRGGRR